MIFFQAENFLFVICNYLRFLCIPFSSCTNFVNYRISLVLDSLVYLILLLISLFALMKAYHLFFFCKQFLSPPPPPRGVVRFNFKRPGLGGPVFYAVIANW